MKNTVYKHIEIVGTSSKSIEDAISGAVSKAGETLRGIEWFEILSTRGSVEEGKVKEYQVILKIGLKLE